jgi:hypothetical protein
VESKLKKGYHIAFDKGANGAKNIQVFQKKNI